MTDSELTRTPAARLFGLSVIMGVLIAGMVFPFVAVVGVVSNQAADTVVNNTADLSDEDPPSTTTVTDAAGNPIAYLYDQNRTVVPGETISPAMKAAIVATEDRRFYDHQGVDWQGTLRAVIANSASGDVVQGASTITQQYVKNFQLYVAAKTDSDRLKATEQTPARKLREVRIALQLERKLTKEQILARYLNIVFMGNNSYGVAAAARTYFNSTPDKLTVPQAALLAGMVRSTTAYDPVTHPQAALDRRNIVIGLMADQGMISPSQAAGAKAAPLGVVDPLATRPNGCIGAGDAGYFCKYVVEYLTDYGFKIEDINRRGYTIKTTMDARAMQDMKAALNSDVPPRQPHVANTMSLVSPGADKHRVLAMGSSRTFGLKANLEETSYGLPYEPVNLGAGSIYKIFTAGAALEKGLGIFNRIDVPGSGYASPIYKDAAGRPIPVANDGSYSGSMSLQDALAQSPNTAFIKLEEFTGIPPVVDMAVKLGMRSLDTMRFVDPRTGKRTDRTIAAVTKAQNLASFTLGTTPTSVLELANVGATLASDGMWCPPSPIEQVLDGAGRPVRINEPACAQVVDSGLAHTLLVGMSKDDTSGTAAAAARGVGWNRPMGGKTGTTQQHKSAGFIGAMPAPQPSGAVITFDNSRRPRPLCDGGGGPVACGSGNIYGGKTPARTWYRAMSGYLAGQPVLPLPAVDPRYAKGQDIATGGGVPDVVGLDADEAKDQIRSSVGDDDDEIKVKTKKVDNRAKKGTVVGQEESGDGEVTLLISSGKVPDPPPAPGAN